MKIRRSIFGFVAVVTAALWFGNNKLLQTPLMAFGGTNAAPPGNTTGGAIPSKSERMLGILSAYNDVPIDFYGRVEDQFSNAVADAAVNFSVRVYNGTESTVNRGRAMTDAHGYFTISGYKGESLGLAPAKAGYALATTGTLFKYSHLDDQHYIPDQNNPTVIKMWKLQGAQPLVSINQHYKLRYADAPMNFDLLAGKIVPSGGDLKITVKRPPGVISGRNRLDWSVQIEPVDGGLIDTAGQEKVAYWAPEKGYQPSVTLSASSNGHGVELIQQGFFVQSRNGQVYSKVGFSLRINSDPDGLMNINFGGVANASASRNLEGDPNTAKPQ
jgi:hypothetical protein